MESYRIHLLSLLSSTFLLLLLTVNCEDTDYMETRSLDFFSPVENSFHEKELIDALQEVLEKLKSKRLPSFEKKYGQVPMCDAGEQCAVKKGPRIGKLCDCPRRTSCGAVAIEIHGELIRALHRQQ